MTEIFCSICGSSLSASEESIGFRAEPINDGWCCEQCYRNVVLPARQWRKQTPDQ